MYIPRPCTTTPLRDRTPLAKAHQIRGDWIWLPWQAAVVEVKVDRGSIPGAGCVIKVDGTQSYILTAYHVVKKAVETGQQRVEVRFAARYLDTFEGFVVTDWTQVANDLAVLVVRNAPGQAVLSLGQSERLRLLDRVIAIGHSSFSPWTVTDGKVSKIEGRDILFSGDAVHTGNSGGPLLDEHGRMVGLNIEVRDKLGVAVQIDVIKPILRSWIGDVLASAPTTTVTTPSPPVRTATPAPQEPTKVIRGKDGKAMLLVSEGWFVMGSTDAEVQAAFQLGKRYSSLYIILGVDWFDAEKPQHRVWVDAFYMDQYEVTMAEYTAFLRATGRQALPDEAATYAPVANTRWWT